MTRPRPATAPGPRGWPVRGALPAARKDALGFLTAAARTHGDVVRLRFGPVVAHLLNHPDHIEHVLSRGAATYDKATRSVAAIRATCGASLLSSDGPDWQRHRRLIQPVFQPRALDGLPPVIDAVLSPMLDRWDTAARQGQPIDIVDEMMQLMIAVSVRFLFSADIDPARIDAALRVLLADTWRRLEALVDLSRVWSGFHRPAFRRALADIDDLVLGLIRARRGAADPPDDLLTRLLGAHQATGGDGLSDRDLRDAAVTLILAGHETVANALARALVLLDGAPDLGGHDPLSVWSETLRLYPSIWIMERRVRAADTIGGFAIAKGSTILISPYVLHRHPAFWPDPDRFDPARFAPGAGTDRPRHAYLPFGLGPHRCIGLHMANRVAAHVLPAVAARFRLLPCPGQQTGVVPGLTLRPVAGILMQPVARGG